MTIKTNHFYLRPISDFICRSHYRPSIQTLTRTFFWCFDIAFRRNSLRTEQTLVLHCSIVCI